MEQTNVKRKIRIMVRLNEEEYKYLQSLKNRLALLTTSEAIRYLIHRFKEIEEVSNEIFSLLYKEFYNIAFEEFRKELNRLLENSSNKPSSSKPIVSDSL